MNLLPLQTRTRVSAAVLSVKSQCPFPIAPFLRRYVLLLLVLLWGATALLSQTTWDGSESADWDDADNWTAGVPDAADDVTVPDVATNDPVYISCRGRWRWPCR